MKNRTMPMDSLKLSAAVEEAGEQIGETQNERQHADGEAKGTKIGCI